MMYRTSCLYGRQLTPAGAPVGAPITSDTDANFRNSRCCIVGGCVGASVKNAPTVPYSHCISNWPRSQFSGSIGPAVAQVPTSAFSAWISD